MVCRSSCASSCASPTAPPLSFPHARVFVSATRLYSWLSSADFKGSLDLTPHPNPKTLTPHPAVAPRPQVAPQCRQRLS